MPASSQPVEPPPTCAACGTQLDSSTGIRFGEALVCESCKDAYAQALREGGASDAVDSLKHETLRRTYIGHERWVRSIFYLYLLAEIALMGGGSALLFVGSLAWTAVGVFFVLIGIGMVLIGLGFRRLEPWVRSPGTTISVVGLLLFPIGTLVNGIILWQMHSAKGRMVFSSEYRAAVKATPHLDKTPGSMRRFIIVLAIIIIITITAGGILAFFFGAANPPRNIDF